MNNAPADYPTRDRPPHNPPGWVNSGALFFLTICCIPRGQNQLCLNPAAEIIFESVDFRQRRLDWHVTLLVLMPDHLHLLVSFPPGGDMTKQITDWKSLLARKAGIQWQRDFFDHRLRNDENWEQKANYLRQNPVRGGLAARPEDWAYVWEPTDGGPGRSALPPC